MLTIHQANGRKPRRDDEAQARAVRRVAQLRRLDPYLVDALADPSNLDCKGRPMVMKLGKLLERSISEVRQDLETLRAMGSVGA